MRDGALPDPLSGGPDRQHRAIFDTNPDGATCDQATRAAVGVLGIVGAVTMQRPESAVEIADSMTFDYGLAGAVSVMRTMLHGCPVRDRLLDVVLIASGAKWTDQRPLRMLADIIEGVRRNSDSFPVRPYEPILNAVMAAAWLAHTTITVAADELGEDVDDLRLHLRGHFLRHLAEDHGGGA